MAIDVGRTGIWITGELWESAGDAADEAAAELEELGYGAIWTGSSTADLTRQERILSSTERIVAATGIVSIWLNPADELAANYQRLAAEHPDRLLIGLGSSHAPRVEAEGIHYAKPLSRMRAYLDELDAMEDGIPEDRRILAALGPRALALAAERSLGPHPYLVTPAHTKWAREVIGPDAWLAPEQKVVLDSNPERAREIARSFLTTYLGLPNYTNSLKRQGFTDDEFTDGGSERLVDALVAWGGTDEVLQRVSEHRDAGADHVSLQVIRSDGLPLEEWRRIAEAFRGAPA
ncbi:MAG TPA: LLM class F420-dependent oxidoreductase [Solirubrobacterales bacterium]